MDEAPPTGRKQKADQMRARLLDAAHRIFAVDGVAGLTNRRIALEAGTTTQSIYTYFGSRDELVDEMYRSAIRSVNSIFDAAISHAAADRSRQTILGVFTEAAEGYRRFCLANPAQFRMLIAREPGSDPFGEAGLRDRMVEELVKFGRSGGAWPDAVYESRVRMTVAAIHGFMMSEMSGGITAEHDPDRLFGELLHRCFVNYEDLLSLSDS